MTILLETALFAVGLLLVIKGGDIFVDASVWVSDVSGISRAVIGATLVSFATTAPEFFTSLIATFKGYNEIAVGNAVGSPIANLGLGFALLALFTPGKIADRGFTLKGVIMTLSAALLLAFSLNGFLTPSEGAVLMVIFAISMVINIKSSRGDDLNARRKPTNRKDIAVNIGKFVVGAGALVLGSNLLVDNGQRLALALGIPPSVVGLTFVAIGTSLPEIVTSITAIIKRQNALSIGNIIGANILDTTLILASCSFVSRGGLTVPRGTVTADLPLTLAIMLLAVLPVALGKRIYRLQGAAMLTLYAGYLVFIVI
jgi:cation:H+ antiporter